ncbi:DNA polymerase [Lactobacillus phage SA-C12]|uniref:DNA polymerase III alpha subunit n=1 Tax=Lactobacillus phage SA-C12 TaxID=1755697 RepID=A0A1I9KKI8_9CAUD|nr:DNA polymerase [Lactobacillus phage SA-C12]ALY06941.1 DNA polymerase III alpha subunit [Lactobacillus phage SA-C12]
MSLFFVLIKTPFDDIIIALGGNLMNKQELIEYGYGNLHGHTDLSSNLRLLDSSITVKEMLDYSTKIGMKAISFTGHEALSDHIKAERYYHSNPEKFKNIKLVLGNEIYLVDHDEMQKAEDNNEKFRFNHFLLNAIDKKGHDFLQKQSSLAWSHYHRYRSMERVPSYYDEVESLMNSGDYKGHVIASTACLGSFTSQEILAYQQDNDKSHFENVKNMILWMVKVFGKENVFLELMPSHHEEQIIVNNWLRKISAKMNIPYIITTDAHYLNEAQRPVHSALLLSRNSDRDLTAYDTAHLFSVEELFEFFDDDVLTNAFKALHGIFDRIEDYTLEHSPIVPEGRIPEFEDPKYGDFYRGKELKNIKTMVDSKYKTDRYLMRLALDGLKKHSLADKEEYLERLDLEVGELVKITHNIGQPMSSYFIAQHDFVNIMWSQSLVGPGRGSSSCWLLNYLIGLTQVDALKYKLPHYRFLSAERVTENKASNYPDIDTDSEGTKRSNIIEKIREIYGKDKVLNFSTFSTIKTRSAIQYAGRGLNIDRPEIDYIVSLLPADGHNEWPITDALLGNDKEDRKPSKKLTEEVSKYPKLKETILGLFGLVVGRSEHASGVLIANDSYTAHNALMYTPKGIAVTQFEADDSEYAGMIKFDFLSLSALDKIHSAIDMLVRDHKIEKQGSLHQTYMKYFGPEALDMTNVDMYKMLFNGDVIDAFEFSSSVGYKTLRKLNARDYLALVSANGLMRLTGGDDDELALDRYIRYQNNPDDWDKDMDSAGLNGDEKRLMHELLDDYKGVNNSQERLMQMVLKIAGYSLEEANKLRKSIAKKDKKKQEEQHVFFLKKAKSYGLRDEFANYIWDKQIAIQSGWTEARPF